MRAIVTVAGKDRIGIIAEVCTLLAENNVNVMDISQTVMQEYFTMAMLVDTSVSTLPFSELVELVRAHGVNAGLDIRIQREDFFNAMHRI